MRVMALSALALVLGTGCSDGFGGLLISNAREVQIGEGVDQQIEAEYPIVDAADPVAQWAVQFISPLVQGSRPFRDPDLIGGYKIEIIADDELVNAFAAPGGFTYITTGLLLAADTCAEIAGVMGHELAHVTERHGVKDIEAAFAAEQLASFFLDEGLARDGAVAIWALLQNTTFSQDDESESDLVGLQIAFNAGYNPHGLADFFAKLAALEAASGTFLPEFLSSHPSSQSRVTDVRAEIQRRYGDQVVQGQSQSYDCLGTGLTLEQVKAHIQGGNMVIRPGTGTGVVPGETPEGEQPREG